ncbi:helix-turn-helix transcriptional regulator [Pontibacter populi]|uniref:AraC family transcriptional regulator n=1 Tax=Pontibacter populi TaxID=890055 RepID=A0ABV1RXZ8_9BACT
MKGLSFVNLQEQLLQGPTGHYTWQDEFGVQSSLFESANGDLSLWHKTIQFPGVLIDHLKIKAPSSVVIQTSEKIPSTINLGFTLQGTTKSFFDDLPHPVQNAPLKHNLLYLANPAGKHVLNPIKQLENIHLAFQPEYFQDIISDDEPPFEKIKDNMERKRSMLFALDHGLIDLKIQQVLLDICNCVMKGSVKRLYMEAKVLELLALQVDSLYKPTTSGKNAADTDLFQQIRAYLTVHYLEEITLHSVCRHFGINEFKLKKGFQLHFQTSVIRYLTSLRMQQAKQLLELGECTIFQVSELLNYSHPNHFSIAFKKYFGISPSEVRRAKKVF